MCLLSDWGSSKVSLIFPRRLTKSLLCLGSGEWLTWVSKKFIKRTSVIECNFSKVTNFPLLTLLRKHSTVGSFLKFVYFTRFPEHLRISASDTHTNDQFLACFLKAYCMGCHYVGHCDWVFLRLRNVELR